MTDKQPLSTQEHNQVMQAMVDKWAESFGTGFAVYMVEQTNNSSPDESRAWNESMDRGRAIVEAVKHDTDAIGIALWLGYRIGELPPDMTGLSQQRVLEAFVQGISAGRFAKSRRDEAKGAGETPS